MPGFMCEGVNGVHALEWYFKRHFQSTDCPQLLGPRPTELQNSTGRVFGVKGIRVVGIYTLV